MGNITETQKSGREVWIDWARIIACFMVIVVHCTEPFYLSGEDGAFISSKSNALWAAFFDSVVRACVPVFIVISCWLQFPLHYSAGEFFRRRAVRILIPFALWTVVYAVVWGEPVENFKDLIFNFNYAAGHLWFVYMLLGIYLLMPLLSPWAARVGKRELRFYLAIWLFTTLIPLIRDWMGGQPTLIFGPSGLPRQSLWPLWGEASWNGYGLFYYFSGFVGYLLLGLYLRKFVPVMSWLKTLAVAVPCYAAGFAVSFGGFLTRVWASSGGEFPTGDLTDAVWWETTWCNDTVGVALMTVAWILVLRKIKCDGGFYKRVVLPLSKAGYGMYLCHLLILSPIFAWICEWLGGVGSAGAFGVWTAPVEILLAAVCTFACTGAVSAVLQRIPKVGKYIIG